MPAIEAVTEDRVLGGRVRLTQPARGYRAAIDPVFLAAAVPARAGERVLELGTGAAAAALCLAARVAGCRVTGLEIQAGLAALARRNATANRADLTVVEGDVGTPPAVLGAGYDHVMANPPFFRAEAGSLPAESRRAAMVEGRPLSAWLATALARVRRGGTVTVILAAERSCELLAEARGVVLSLLPRAGAGPCRVLFQVRAGADGPLRCAPGVALHEADGTFTAAATAVLWEAAALVL